MSLHSNVFGTSFLEAVIHELLAASSILSDTKQGVWI